MDIEKFNKVKYNNNFNKENYDRISLMLPKGMRESLKQISESRGFKSVNALIVAAIESYIKG